MSKQDPTPIGVKEALIEARQLIVDGWVQNRYAETAYGYKVKSTEPDASKFCMLGAMERVMDNRFLEESEKRNPYTALWEGVLRAFPKEVKRIAAKMPSAWLDEFNDEEWRTQEEVLRAFDTAINIVDETEGN